MVHPCYNAAVMLPAAKSWSVVVVSTLPHLPPPALPTQGEHQRPWWVRSGAILQGRCSWDTEPHGNLNGEFIMKNHHSEGEDAGLTRAGTRVAKTPGLGRAQSSCGPQTAGTCWVAELRRGQGCWTWEEEPSPGTPLCPPSTLSLLLYPLAKEHL